MQQIVAVSNNSRIYASPDTIVPFIPLRYFTSSSDIMDIAYSSDYEMFVYVSSGGGISYSFTLINSSGPVTGTTFRWHGVVYNPITKVFVAVGENGQIYVFDPVTRTGTLYTSSFGTSIIKDIAWSPALSLYVAVGDTGKCATSPDGITWTQRVCGQSASNIYTVTWSPTLNLFILAGNGALVSVSSDGITWSQYTTGLGTIARDSAWSASLGLFAICGTSKVMTSPNGQVWTLRDPGTTDIVTSIFWSDRLGLFIVGTSGTPAKIFTSPTSVVWTAVELSSNSTTLVFYAIIDAEVSDVPSGWGASI